ncbi:MFS transporter [Companilactobacillus crustorum]|uniref:MFS transporter n=1 Tax=Companilactobacillus crustorum TaxID=392416 RepID=UPI00214FC107|nr:MFS transporter [Companilactobacillus crustorum]WDT66824.1 MFS transporter [Companilactobacillus crustorum]
MGDFKMAICITGTGLVNAPILIAAMWLAHSFKLPIMIVAVFKYLDTNFEARLSSILYLGIIVIIFSVIAVFALKKDNSQMVKNTTIE